ncbi:hypothetical protein JXA47_06385 [Candidatus Sumerlaeota bacterium]|nr:hypothetical protein [Candidatus Sumerlaeota bacterium]
MTDPTAILTVENVACHTDQWRGGDLHVCSEGVFFIAMDQRITGCGWTLLLAALCPIGIIAGLVMNRGDIAILSGVLLVILALVSVMRSRGRVERWRAGLHGKQLDRLVDAIPGSVWVRTDEIVSLRIGPISMGSKTEGLIVECADGSGFEVLKGSGHGRHEALGEILDHARALGWPVR